MSNAAISSRYSTPVIALHWLTFVLVVAGYCAMEFREIFDRGTPGREFMKASHFTIGLCILLITIARLIVRTTSGPAPAIVPPLPALMAAGSKLLHLALYGFLIAMPILGWLTLSAEGKVIPFFGVGIPPLTGADKALAEWVGEWHETLGKAGYVLIGLHALAAIVHHRYIKDNTLIRMMPARGESSA